jgi:hypothetical protein
MIVARYERRNAGGYMKTTGSPNGAGGEDEEKFIRYFDPNQDADERRDLKRKSRALEREFNGE